jgi:hypothetical protein
VKNTAQIDEGGCFWTLSKGKEAKPFWAIVDEKGIKILTGGDTDSIAYLNNKEIKRCLIYFSDQDWFPLGSQVYRSIYQYLRTMKVDDQFVITNMLKAPPQSMNLIEGSNELLCKSNVATWIQPSVQLRIISDGITICLS